MIHRIKAYSALDESEIHDYATAINQSYPEIVLDVERLSTTETCSPVVAGDRSIAVTVSTAVGHAVRLHPSIRVVVPHDACRFEPDPFRVRRTSPNVNFRGDVVNWMAEKAGLTLAARYQKRTPSISCESASFPQFLTELIMKSKRTEHD